MVTLTMMSWLHMYDDAFSDIIAQDGDIQNVLPQLLLPKICQSCMKDIQKERVLLNAEVVGTSYLLWMHVRSTSWNSL